MYLTVDEEQQHQQHLHPPVNKNPTGRINQHGWIRISETFISKYWHINASLLLVSSRLCSRKQVQQHLSPSFTFKSVIKQQALVHSNEEIKSSLSENNNTQI